MVLRKGSKVSWSWGPSTASGKIVERFTGRVTRTIKGTKVTRDASREEPAYLIEQEDGDRVLKSRSEINHAED
ncbi:hypervirulence associated TUDOR domain-containing protein [Devosia sp. CAU 1758]